MPSANFRDSRYRLDYTVSTLRQDIANNRSQIRRTLVMVKTGSSSAWSSDPVSNWSSNGPTSHNGNFGFDFRRSSSLKLFEITEWVGHNSDGSKSFTSTGYARADLPNGFDSAQVNIQVTLRTIPRATTPRLPSSFTTGQSGRISLPRASGNFSHRTTYNFGRASGVINEDTGDYVD